MSKNIIYLQRSCYGTIARAWVVARNSQNAQFYSSPLIKKHSTTLLMSKSDKEQVSRQRACGTQPLTGREEPTGACALCPSPALGDEMVSTIPITSSNFGPSYWTFYNSFFLTLRLWSAKCLADLTDNPVIYLF